MDCLLARHRQDAAAALRTAVAGSAPHRDYSGAVLRPATVARRRISASALDRGRGGVKIAAPFWAGRPAA